MSLLLKICPLKSKALLVGLNSQLHPSLYKLLFKSSTVLLLICSFE